MATIGLLFGSFNPIHLGHEQIALYVLKQPTIEQVWLVVSPLNPLKTHKELLDDKARLKMAEIVAQQHANIHTSAVEFSLPKPSFTANTLLFLKKKYPEHQFCLIIGGDNIAIFDQWYAYQTILDNYQIVVYDRPKRDKTTFTKHPNVTVLSHCPMLDISSTEVRERIAKKQQISTLLNPLVLREIEQKGYYHLF